MAPSNGGVDYASIIVALFNSCPSWLIVVLAIIGLIAFLGWKCPSLLQSLTDRFQNRKILEALYDHSEKMDEKFDNLVEEMNKNQRISDTNDYVLFMSSCSHWQRLAIKAGGVNEECFLEYKDKLNRLRTLHDRYCDKGISLGFDESYRRIMENHSRVQKFFDEGKFVELDW